MAGRTKLQSVSSLKNPSSRDSPSSLNSSKTNVICPVCEERIVDESAKRKGQDAVFCDHTCKTWLHRRCAGLSRDSFDAVSRSNSPFYCPQCRMNTQGEELLLLRESIHHLTAAVLELKSTVARLEASENVSVPQFSPAMVTQSSPPSVLAPPHSSRSVPKSDSKYNLIFFGISECAKVTKYHDRVRSDHASISTLLQSVPGNDNLTSISVRDCIRLGKYQEQAQYPRPILVKFNSFKDVSGVLSVRARLVSAQGSPISVKRDLPKGERLLESMLLKERRNLINEGVERNVIKIKGNKLYARTQVVGEAFPTGFVKHSQSTTSAGTNESHSDLPVDNSNLSINYISPPFDSDSSPSDQSTPEVVNSPPLGNSSSS